MGKITITNEMQEALDLITETSEHIFITGKAGTGKTTLLHYIADNVQKQSAITAPTGIAALNAKGVTLHSMFQIPFGALTPYTSMGKSLRKSKIALIKKLDILIIDEIGMVRPDTLDFIDRRLRHVRGNNKPFGGVQLVMFGDLYQLPPVVKSNEEKVLEQFYDTPFFFSALAFTECGFHIASLNHIFRQSDPEFINLLNHIRTYDVSDDDIEMLCELRNQRDSSKYDNGNIHICTHRTDVDRINEQMLGTPTKEYHAVPDGQFNMSAFPGAEHLKLRIGARVMALSNNQEIGYHNGSLGVVTDMGDDWVEVYFDDGVTAKMTAYEWEAYEYEIEDKKIAKKTVGTCKQIPLALAWAITIHKSQGLTFDKVTIHTRNVFCSGLVYVALSRCTSMEGVICDSFITKKHIIPEPSLREFEKVCQQTNYFKRIR